MKISLILYSSDERNIRAEIVTGVGVGLKHEIPADMTDFTL